MIDRVRRQLAQLWLLGAIAAGAGCGQETPRDASTAVAEPRDPLNILLISIDSLRADHLGAYGYERDTSPHLDALAERGVLFETVVAETSWTLPSHVSLLTGLSSLVHGVTWDYQAMDPALTTLAQRLGAQGYRTEGYVTGPYLHSIFGFGRGFERYELLGGSMYDDRHVSLQKISKSEELKKASFEENTRFASERTSPALVAKVEQALARAGSDPFFLFVHMFDVHTNYDPPEEYWRRFNPDYAGDLDPGDFRGSAKLGLAMPPEDREQLVALYDGEIRWTDEHVGKMLEALDRYGVSDRTIVVVTSDHGDEFFEHGDLGHRKTLWDEQLLVPLIIAAPGSLPEGRRVAMQVRLIDVMPTLLDLLGLEASEAMSGESLVSFVREEREERDLPALSLLRHPGARTQTLRTSTGKIVRTWPPLRASKDSSVQLDYYDLEADPGEQQPLTSGAVVEAEAARFRELSAQARALRETLRGKAAPKVKLPPRVRHALQELGYVEPDDLESE